MLLDSTVCLAMLLSESSNATCTHWVQVTILVCNAVVHPPANTCALLCCTFDLLWAGLHQPQRLMVVAEAGTGKTWMTNQIVYFLSRDNSYPLRSRYIPLLISVQRLVFLARTDHVGSFAWNKVHGRMLVGRKGDLLEWYLRSEYKHRNLARRRDMLLDAYHSQRLIIIIDGLDEASDLKMDIQRFVLEKLVPGSHRFVVTTRPEGANLDCDGSWLARVGIKPYQQAQQKVTLLRQLNRDSMLFIDMLTQYARQTKLFQQRFNKVAAAVAPLCQVHACDKIRLVNQSGTKLYNDDMLQSSVPGVPTAKPTSVETVDELLFVAKKAQHVWITVLPTIARHFGIPVFHTLKALEKSTAGEGRQMHDTRTQKQHIQHLRRAGGVPTGLVIDRLKSAEHIERDVGRFYKHEMGSGVRGGSAYGWVHDVVRAMFICASSDEGLQVLAKLREQKDVEIVKLVNHFAQPDHLHRRYLDLVIRITVKTETGVVHHHAELKVYHSALFTFGGSELQPSYDYFHEMFGKHKSTVYEQYTSSWLYKIQDQLDGYAAFLGNPVLISMLSLVLRESRLSRGLRLHEIPSLKSELYSKAVRIILTQRITKADKTSDEDIIMRPHVLTLLHALKVIASAGHFHNGVGRREFSFAQLSKALERDDVNQGGRLLQAIEWCMEDTTGSAYRVPLLRVLSIASTTEPSAHEGIRANFESTHASLQEYLSAQHVAEFIHNEKKCTDVLSDVMAKTILADVPAFLNQDRQSNFLTLVSPGFVSGLFARPRRTQSC